MHRDRVNGNSFVERHRLWSAAQEEAMAGIDEQIKQGKVDVVRFSFPDQHGLLRGKSIIADHAVTALRDGVTIPTSLIAKDTAHRTVFPLFTPGGGFGMSEMQGASDMLMIADPQTFRVLPWLPRTGWVLCDAYFQDGRVVPFATRSLLRNALQRLGDAGFEFVVGLEIEFHVFRLLNPRLQTDDVGQPGEPPDVELLSQGYQYLTEIRFDQIEPVAELLRKNVVDLNLPLRSLEIEYGPSQFEFTFLPIEGLAAADAMVLFRNSVKQICRRNGFHATFMCRPRIPDVMSSGWHLHQSLRGKSDQTNAFAAENGGLSRVGQQFLAGLLAHAGAVAAFATPTLNGYKRYRPYSLAPDRVSWGHDNRGALLRVVLGDGTAATRIENRIGEPAANPYLYLASQIYAGLDGIGRELDPGPSETAPYEAEAERLPHTLSEALDCLRQNTCLRDGFGQPFIDYFCHIKEAEISRFNLEVTEWEQREYFDLF
jgi:glutamine synthetase